MNETLVASPSTLRSLAKSIRENGFTYEIKRITWKNFNRTWNGYRGLSLVVSREAYLSLYEW